MYTIVKNVIDSGEYKLTDIQHKVKRLYLLGDLSEGQMDELLEMAQYNASADSERPALLSLISNLAERLEAIESILKQEEVPSPEDDEGTDDDNDTDGSANTGTPSEPTVIYEPWAPWDGISNKYQYGAIVSHNGGVWQSDFTGQNVWEPGTVGTEKLWKPYIEEQTQPKAEESEVV